MSSFVLVPGACHGGWCFDPIVEPLRERGHRVLAATLSGLSFDPRARPHPLPTLLPRIRLRGGLSRLRRRDCAYATGWEGESPLAPTHRGLLDDPLRHVHAVDGRHNPMCDAPRELAPPLSVTAI